MSVEKTSAQKKRDKTLKYGKLLRTRSVVDGEKLLAKVLMGWITGKTQDQIAEETNLSKATISRILGDCDPALLEQLKSSKTDRITELVQQNLEDNLLAMNRIVGVTEDEIWVKAQRAPELATFFGVISDKTVRVLSAIERANAMHTSRGDRHEEVEELHETPQVVRA